MIEVKHAVPLAVCFRAEKSVPDFFNAKKQNDINNTTLQFHLSSVFVFMLPYLRNVLKQTNNAPVPMLGFMICPLPVNTAM